MNKGGTDYEAIVFYIMLTACVGCYLTILWQMLNHRQWKMALLCLFFSLVCFSSFYGLGGFVIALIIGWQEAGPWKIKTLMRWYTAAILIFTVLVMRDVFRQTMKLREEPLTKKGRVQIKGLPTPTPKAR